MQPETKILFEELRSKDDKVRYPAFQNIYALTEQPVDWAYEVWDQLVAMLRDENSYQRNIAIKLFCNLGRSDSEKRMAALMPELLAHTKDEKFITSRMALQEVWKIAWYEPELAGQVVESLKKRFAECSEESHANLLRQDIIQSLTTLAELRHDEPLAAEVEQLIDSEPDEKSRKSYRSISGKVHQ